jgi:hypothetical protein
MLKSIVRGFGFTVGRRAADSMIDNLNQKNSPRTSSTSVKDKTCMSHLGYEENDVEIMYDIKWNKEYVKWYEWPLYLFIPVIPVFYALSRAYKTFVKKYQLHFYDMKWNTYTISDNRAKSGTREIKKLEPVFDKSAPNTPYTRNKIEAILALILVIPINLLIFTSIASAEKNKTEISPKNPINSTQSSTITKTKLTGGFPKLKKTNSHELHRGKRGGLYYYNDKGNKVYVK